MYMPVGVCPHARACMHTCVPCASASVCVRVRVRACVSAHRHTMCWEFPPHHFRRPISPVFPAVAGNCRWLSRRADLWQEAAGHVWTRPSSQTSLCRGRAEGKREGPKGLCGDAWPFPLGPALLGRVSGLRAVSPAHGASGLRAWGSWCGFLLPELRRLPCPGHAGSRGWGVTLGGGIVDSRGSGSGGGGTKCRSGQGGAGPSAEASGPCGGRCCWGEAGLGSSHHRHLGS